VSSKKLKTLCDTCTPATADGGGSKSDITPIHSHSSVAPTECTAWIVQMATTSGCPRTGRAGLPGGRQSAVGSLESVPTRRRPTSGNMTALIVQQAHPELIHDGGTTRSGWRLVRIGHYQPLIWKQTNPPEINSYGRTTSTSEGARYRHFGVRLSMPVPSGRGSLAPRETCRRAPSLRDSASGVGVGRV
jgi:hypothetical protein